MCFCYHLEDCKSVWAKPAMDGGQEPISSSDTLVPDLLENEQGVVQDGSESLSNHGCQVVPEICFIEVVDLSWGWEKFCFYVFLFVGSW
jgi:hypothetical protein